MNIRRWIAVGAAAVAAATATATAANAATTPAQHGYSQQDLQRDLDAITATGVPGVLAEVRTGDRQLRGTSGVADLDSRQPVNGNGFFRIGSNTKTFLSVVVLQLAAEHRLSLDDTVGHWLPGVVHGNGNDGGTITVRELLQHTSGLHNYTDDLQAQITSPEAYRQLEFRRFSRQDLLDIALAHRPDFAPGAGLELLQHQLHPARNDHRKGDPRLLGEPGHPPHHRPARTSPHLCAGHQHPAARGHTPPDT